MLFAHEELKRDIRNARKVLWWSFTLEMFSVSLASLSLSYGNYALVLFSFSTTLLLTYYVLFLGFSRLAKHFHAMPIFWMYVIGMIFSVFFSVIDVVEKLYFYGMYDPYKDVSSGVAVLTSAVLTFLYGIYIMRLPQKKFGNILFRARVAYMGKALLMTAMVYLGVAAGSGTESLPYGLAALGVMVMIVVTNIIDYMILGKALRLVGGVLPHAAPSPHHS